VASKHAVLGLTKSAALDHARDRIRVNAISPGVIDTPLLQSVPLDLADAMSENCMHRNAQPEELVPTILLLSSDAASSYTTGAGFLVDGGQINKT
jgi:NAD(P)-dependent dehydrogenase (short-subunit alcohol dehydrogenase family)